MGWESWPWNTAIVNDGTCTSQLYIYTYYIYIYMILKCFLLKDPPRMNQKKQEMNICGTKFQLKPTETDLQKQWKPPWKLRGLKGLELGHVRRQNLRKPPGCFFFFSVHGIALFFGDIWEVKGHTKLEELEDWSFLWWQGGSLSLIIVIHPWNLQGWNLCFCLIVFRCATWEFGDTDLNYQVEFKTTNFCCFMAGFHDFLWDNFW